VLSGSTPLPSPSPSNNDNNNNPTNTPNTNPKAALLDSLFGTERGLAARSEVRAEINELITQLEANNPNPSPTEVCGGGCSTGCQF
jgi:hypothetical protein